METLIHMTFSPLCPNISRSDIICQRFFWPQWISCSRSISV